MITTKTRLASWPCTLTALALIDIIRFWRSELTMKTNTKAVEEVAVHMPSLLFWNTSEERTQEQESLPWSNTNTQCFGNNGRYTLDNWAFRLSRLSSPPKSPSWEKTRRLLDSCTSFYIPDLSTHIFNSTMENMATMLVGYGLKRVPTLLDNNTILVEIPFPRPAYNVSTTPRIILQTEQKETKTWSEYLTECHKLPRCVIWEYSTYNLEVQTKMLGVQDSVLLIPHMIHNRFDALVPPVPKPILQRKHDVVFFALITKRRAPIKSELKKMAATDKRSVVIEKKWNMKLIQEAYQNSKVCLVAHAYSAKSAAEYHRMSEFAKFGCVPIMEKSLEWDIQQDAFWRCAGLISVDLANIKPTIMDVLKKKIHFADMQQRIDWWKKGIEWSTLLNRIFQNETADK